MRKTSKRTKINKRKKASQSKEHKMIKGLRNNKLKEIDSVGAKGKLSILKR